MKRMKRATTIAAAMMASATMVAAVAPCAVHAAEVDIEALDEVAGGDSESQPVWHTVPADPDNPDTFTIPDLMPERNNQPVWHTIPEDPNNPGTFTIPDLMS